MSRFRIRLLATGLSFAGILLASATLAQGPGGPGGGPGGGRGGNSNLGLVQVPAVQDELKLTKDQKTKIESLAQAVDKKRQAIMPRRNRGNNNIGGPGNNSVAANDAEGPGGGGNNGGNGSGPGNGGGRRNRGGNGGNNLSGNGGNDFAGGPGGPGGPGGDGFAGGPGGNGFDDPGGNGFGGGPGGDSPQFAEIRQQMQDLQNQSDTALGKILKKPQVTRLLQIKLQRDYQRQGLSIVASDELSGKFNLSPDQVEQINAITQQNRDARRQMFQDMLRPDFSQFRNADGSFNREAMQAAMDTPEAKDQRQQMTSKMDSLRKQGEAQITKVLTKNQLANFKKMMGQPFDLASLNQGGPGGPFGPGGPGAGNNGTNATNNAAGATKDGTMTPDAKKKTATSKVRKTSSR